MSRIIHNYPNPLHRVVKFRRQVTFLAAALAALEACDASAAIMSKSAYIPNTSQLSKVPE